MAKAWLRDDPACALPEDDGLVGRVVVALDGDEPCATTGLLPGEIRVDTPPDAPQVVDDPRQRVLIRRRIRAGMDADGNPVFEWETVLDGLAQFSSVRRELDALSGVTSVKAKAMVEYDGSDRIFETAVLQRVSDGTVWRITATRQPYGRVEMDLLLLDQEGEGFPIDVNDPIWLVRFSDLGDGYVGITGMDGSSSNDGYTSIGD